MAKYSDDEIRNIKKITCRIAADYLGIPPMAVSIGMRNDLLPIGFAVHNVDRHSDSWTYHIIAERLIAQHSTYCISSMIFGLCYVSRCGT